MKMRVKILYSAGGCGVCVYLVTVYCCGKLGGVLVLSGEQFSSLMDCWEKLSVNLLMWVWMLM